MKIITGSGRSGTSFVAKIIDQVQGLAGSGLLWEPDVRAGMEEKAIVDLNKTLFEWNGIKRPYSDVWMNDHQIAYAKAEIAGAGYVDQLNLEWQGKWVKDPLFSKTLKIWLEMGLQVEHIIVCTRNPHDSMTSSKRTNRGFEPAYGYTEEEIEKEMNTRQGYLWDIILRYALPYSVVRYEHMLEDFPAVLDLLVGEGSGQYRELIQKEWHPNV